MYADEDQLDQITEKIIGSAYRIGNELGAGFLEKVYENAMVPELRKAGLQVAQQWPIEVKYDGVVVGEFCADLLVEGMILVELKAIRSFDEFHSAQCINYLTATGFPVCLLINFGKRVDVKRFVNIRKPTPA